MINSGLFMKNPRLYMLDPRLYMVVYMINPKKCMFCALLYTINLRFYMINPIECTR